MTDRLARLEDIESARGILFDYAQLLDDPDPAAVAGLFTVDGVLRTARGDATGHAEIERFYALAFAADPSTKRHFVTNTKSTWLCPGRVRLDSYFLYTGRGADRSVIGWGTYADIVDVTGAEPRFAEKTIDVHVGTTLADGWPG